jgi:uncharacterized membrane protein YidH (DUF202 family)
MTVIGLAFSLLVIVLGVLGLVSPSRVVRIARYFQTPAGLYFAAMVRLVLGVALYFSAPASRAPEVLRLLGVIIIFAGVGTLFVGVERYRRLVDWWLAKGHPLVRAQAAFALALGLLLAYAFFPW